MTKPTPLFIATMIGLILVFVSLWIIGAVYNHEMDRRAEELLQSQRPKVVWPSPYPPKGEDNEETERL